MALLDLVLKYCSRLSHSKSGQMDMIGSARACISGKKARSEQKFGPDRFRSFKILGKYKPDA
jgi:hypothetical protein